MRNLVIDRLSMFSGPLFEEVFDNRAQSVAVVGNGVVDQESESWINDADVVVRFNNWNSRDICKDVTLPNSGTRCEVVVSHLDCQPILTHPWSLPRLLVLAIPAPFQIDRNPFYLEERYGKISVAMVNPYVNRLACLELGLNSSGWAHPLPTVGFTFLYHFWRFNLDYVRSIYLCGFDWHYDIRTDTYQNVSLVDQKATPNNHSYLREARWIQKNLLRDPRWIFSSRTYTALSRLERISKFGWEQLPPV